MSDYTHCSDLFKLTDVTSHQEGSRSHEEVQHSSSQHRNIWLLPGQRLKQMEWQIREKLEEILEYVGWGVLP